MTQLERWGLSAAAMLLTSLTSTLAGVADFRVTTNTSVDCSSVQTIARDLYAPCKTDQERAIAAWYLVRRVEFHWPHIPT